jgi:hypothetical protein
VVCPSIAPHSKFLESLDVYELDSVLNDTVRVVSQSREYQVYLKLVPATTPRDVYEGEPDYPGSLMPVLNNQEDVLHPF